MTINGPAPMILGFFFNAAIDQQCEKYIKENGLEESIRKKIKKSSKKKISLLLNIKVSYQKVTMDWA